MTIAATSSLAFASAHHDFLSALPNMQRSIRCALRKLPRRYRAEAIHDQGARQLAFLPGLGLRTVAGTDEYALFDAGIPAAFEIN